MAADLLIRSRCVFPDRKCQGFVLRLSRREAHFTTREPISTGERGRLELELPWRLGRIQLPVDVGTCTDAELHPPGVRLVFGSVPASQLDSIERYLTRYYDLLAQLQT